MMIWKRLDGWCGAMVTHLICRLTRHPCLDKVIIIKHRYSESSIKPPYSSECHVSEVKPDTVKVGPDFCGFLCVSVWAMGRVKTML